MCISWTRKGLISLMHGVTMKNTVISNQYYTNAQLFITNTTQVKIAIVVNELVNLSGTM